VPHLVQREALTSANALLQQLAGFVKIGAPIVGGLIVAALGPQRAMLFDLLTFGVAALVLTQLPSLPARPNSVEDLEAVRAEEVARNPTGIWTTLRNTPGLQMLFVILFLGILVIMGFDVLSSIAVRDLLQADERFFGMLIGLVGLGSVLAGLMLMLRKQQVNPWYDVIVGLLLLSLLPLSITLSARLQDLTQIRALVACGAFIGGLGNGLIVVQVSTLLQLLSPPSQLGRLSGVFQSTIAAAQLITIVATPLLVPALFSVGSFFGWSALALGGVALVAALLLRRPSMQTPDVAKPELEAAA
jgi:DHA3 family macrolide efflux protein-like MFS transporter